ncbi:MAG: efflux RND transporter periplasmic adaptor subunit [Deltaproteobacteria bacterium]|nr:efflux RND transporter periplasmic adaptor subunit [Deltaproteobacteria bacterium]
MRDLLTPKRVLIGAGVMALVVLMWFFIPAGFKKKSSEKDPGQEAHTPGQVKLDQEAIQRAKIEAAPATMGPMANKVLLTGELVFNEEKTARVSSRLSGRVVKIIADYGAEVKKGDALAVIDSVELGQAQNSFLQAVASYNVAQKAYERALLLWQEKAISQAEFLERQAKVELGKAERDFAENRLHLLGLSDADIARLLRGGRKTQGPSFHAAVDSTFILRAPIAGRVVDRKVTPGLVVKAEEELFVVADTATLWCFVQIPEKDLPLVKPGCMTAIKVSALPQEEFTGCIDYIAAMVDKASRMTRARVQVNNSGGLLNRSMRGGLITNRPQVQRTYFQTVNLSGPLEPGWEVPAGSRLSLLNRNPASTSNAPSSPA